MRRYPPGAIIPSERIAKEETMNLGTKQPTVEEIKTMLGLEPHPTCGFVAETYRSPLEIPTSALPEAYEGDRPYGSALYFLVTPEAQIVMHRIRSDQLYHHYLGASLEVLLLYPDGNGEVVTVGSDLGAGERPQLFLPGGTFHTSRLAPGANYALLASTEWPGVEPPDVEHGDVRALMEAYPDLREEIRAFTS
jgi:predicted cupin superfamily sugar epimerase